MVDGSTLRDGATLLTHARFGHHVKTARLGDGHGHSGWWVDRGALRDGAHMERGTRLVWLEWDPGGRSDRLW